MRILKVIALLFVLLLAVLAFNLWRLPGSPPPVAPVALLEVDEQAVAERLAAAVRIATVSYEDRSTIDGAKLAELAALLQTSFPKAHAVLKREVVNEHSLLYTWTGSDPALKPALFLAHMDVVPVEPGTEAAWTHAPFSGDIADGFVWGRGSIDDKSSVLALMEAVEALVASGYTPKRTLYFAFGHDEEIGGAEGAAKIAELLKSRGIKAGFALDEGGAITQGVVQGIDRPVASIMAAEKGYVSLRLAAHAAGGHSSLPPSETAISRLARALVRVHERPMPVRLIAPVTDMLERLSPQMPFVQRLAIANRWLFQTMLVSSLGSSPVGNALLRTTTAPTMLGAGVKDNVLPSEAWAVINFRLLPGDSIEMVEKYLHRVIADDGIEIQRYGHEGNEASPLSDSHTPAFAAIERSVNEVFPDAVVASGIVLATTDLRNYAGVFENRYNFSPTPLTSSDLPRIHGTNERIAVKDYAQMIRFYARLIGNLDAPP